MKLIIQIPCYNEEETLGITIGDLPRQIEGVDIIEYLIINDGSKDNTVKVAEELGVHHIVSFKNNKGLAKGFMAGLDAGLKLGADIIVNTDADNQYCGDDIEKLIKPIMENKADMVIGERPIMQTKHFSPMKKRFQKLGSLVVRSVSGTEVPDAPSGFRAYNRECAMRLNVVSEYTYTLETIIQAGMKNMSITSVPIRTNEELRESRLFSSMFGYMKKSAITIIRSFLMYKPLKFFITMGLILFIFGTMIWIRFIYLFISNGGAGNIQSLILASILIFMGVQSVVMGLLADIIASNRKLLEDIQLRIRKMEYDEK